MGFREWIIPQDKAFFAWLDEVAANAVACADALAALFNDYGRLTEHRQKVKDLEHKGDQLSHTIFDALTRSFITPIDREDLAALTHAFDDILDYIHAAVNRLYLYEVRNPTPAMARLAQLLQAQTRELQSALGEIQNPRTRKAALKHSIEVNRLENEADTILNEAVAELFKTSDAIRIMRHKEVLEHLETATDKCEDVADVLADIARKHS